MLYCEWLTLEQACMVEMSSSVSRSVSTARHRRDLSGEPPPSWALAAVGDSATGYGVAPRAPSTTHLSSPRADIAGVTHSGKLGTSSPVSITGTATVRHRSSSLLLPLTLVGPGGNGDAITIPSPSILPPSPFSLCHMGPWP